MMRYPKVETRSRNRRVVDGILLDIFFLLLGFFIAIVLVSYFPLPWYAI